MGPPVFGRHLRPSSQPLRHRADKLECLVQIERLELFVSQDCLEASVELALQVRESLGLHIHRRVTGHGKFLADHFDQIWIGRV